jgi:lipoprotein-releasing system ATP-binding protein
MNNVLTLRGINRTYTQGENAITPLANFSLEIKAGECVALVGPSGSGKTTLLQIAGLLDNPTSGDISICGADMSKANDALRTSTRKNHVGFVYQFHHLLPEFSALENVMLPQMIAGVARIAAEKKALELLTSLGLAARISHRPAKLSGGECQRVAIARALANNPSLLLADEPTGNLDPQTAAEVFAMFLKLAKEHGLALLVATHNMELAGRMDRVVRLG